MSPLRSSTLASHAPERRRIEGVGTAEDAWRGSMIDRLPICDVRDWVARYKRIWLIAPHPDDEVLALGGSLAMLSALHADLHIVSVTDGEASHRGSSSWTPEKLAEVRPEELRRSLALLDVEAHVMRLGLPDSKVDSCRQQLLRILVDEIGEDDLILTTCSFDGHPDHEACGAVAAVTAELTGATLLEYPVWMWHWAKPDETMIPWHRAQRIDIGGETMEKKRAAIGSFVSQITPDGDSAATLPPAVIERFLRGFEVVFTSA